MGEALFVTRQILEKSDSVCEMEEIINSDTKMDISLTNLIFASNIFCKYAADGKIPLEIFFTEAEEAYERFVNTMPERSEENGDVNEIIDFDETFSDLAISLLEENPEWLEAVKEIGCEEIASLAECFLDGDEEFETPF